MGASCRPAIADREARSVSQAGGPTSTSRPRSSTRSPLGRGMSTSRQRRHNGGRASSSRHAHPRSPVPRAGRAGRPRARPRRLRFGGDRQPDPHDAAHHVRIERTPPTSSSPDASDPVASVEPAPTASPLEGVDLIPIATALGRQIRCTQEEDQCLLEPIEQGDQRWSVLLDGPCRDLLNVEGDAIVACDPPSGATIHVVDQDGNPRRGWPVELGVALASVSWNDLTLGCGAHGVVGASSPRTGPSSSRRTRGRARNSSSWSATGHDGPGGPSRSLATRSSRPGSGTRAAPASPSRTRAAASSRGATRAWRCPWSSTPRGPSSRSIAPTARSSMAGRAARPARPAARSCARMAASRTRAHRARSGPTDRTGRSPRVGRTRSQACRTASVSARRSAGGDGRLAVIQESYTDDGPRTRLHIVLHDGRLAGPVIELPGPVETTCLFGDTPCVGRIDPVFHPRNHDLFIALGSGDDDADPPEFGGSILAFDADGRVRDGWPVALGEGVHAQALSMSLDGPLIVEGITCPQDGCAGGGVSTPISHRHRSGRDDPVAGPARLKPFRRWVPRWDVHHRRRSACPCPSSSRSSPSSPCSSPRPSSRPRSRAHRGDAGRGHRHRIVGLTARGARPGG